jgi:fructokinase
MRIISIGEILWDVIGGTEFLGGAPFNLCAHLSQLGHTAYFVSGVGADPRGERALEQASALGISAEFMTRTHRAPTGISEVVLDENGKATHSLLRPAAYDFIVLNTQQRFTLAHEHPDWICYGTLAQTQPAVRSLSRRLISDSPAARRFYDVNLRPRSWNPGLVENLLRQATAVKLNDDEAVSLAGIFDWPLQSFEQFADLASRRWPLEVVCVTRGARGCALWRSGDYIEHPGFQVEVSDTVGSGDAFSAALLHGLDQSWPLLEIADFANRVGALVASRSGAIPVWTPEEALQLTAQ